MSRNLKELYPTPMKVLLHRCRIQPSKYGKNIPDLIVVTCK